eukprot:scaffold53552_cov66-Phaeocystis_antarctica.AAC.1
MATDPRCGGSGGTGGRRSRPRICPSSPMEMYRGERCRRTGARSLSGRRVEARYRTRCHSAVSARAMLSRSARSTAEIRSEPMPDHDKLM